MCYDKCSLRKTSGESSLKNKKGLGQARCEVRMVGDGIQCPAWQEGSVPALTHEGRRGSEETGAKRQAGDGDSVSPLWGKVSSLVTISLRWKNFLEHFLVVLVC